MSPLKKLQNWWQEKTGEEETPFDGDSSAFFASLLFHMLLLIVLGLVPFVFHNPNVSLTIAAPLKEEFEELGVAEAAGGRFLQAHVEGLGQAGETELAQGGLELSHRLGFG